MPTPIPDTRPCPVSSCDLLVSRGRAGDCEICGRTTTHIREREESQSPRHEGGHDPDVPVLHFVCLSPECQETFDEDASESFDTVAKDANEALRPDDYPMEEGG